MQDYEEWAWVTIIQHYRYYAEVWVSVRMAYRLDWTWRIMTIKYFVIQFILFHCLQMELTPGNWPLWSDTWKALHTWEKWMDSVDPWTNDLSHCPGAIAHCVSLTSTHRVINMVNTSYLTPVFSKRCEVLKRPQLPPSLSAFCLIYLPIWLKLKS